MNYKDLTKEELIIAIKTIINLNTSDRKTIEKIIDLITGNLTLISDGEGKWYFFEGR